MEIKVQKESEGDGQYVFNVEIDSSTKHRVVVDKDYCDDAEDLVKKSFEFLLDREPKEAILKEFNIKEINNYFPEYEEYIKNG